MSKFSKFVTFTAIIGAATAVGVALYKKHQDNKDFIEDDIDDFDDLDDFEDDFGDLESEDRGYTSITSDSEEEYEDDLSGTLTAEEKAALSSDIEDLEDSDDLAADASSNDAKDNENSDYLF